MPRMIVPRGRIVLQGVLRQPQHSVRYHFTLSNPESQRSSCPSLVTLAAYCLAELGCVHVRLRVIWNGLSLSPLRRGDCGCCSCDVCVCEIGKQCHQSRGSVVRVRSSTSLSSERGPSELQSAHSCASRDSRQQVQQEEEDTAMTPVAVRTV